MREPGSGRRAVVVGGLAGMAAAMQLVAAGCKVTLLERRPFLGGRAFSFRDPGTGAVIDNGQHVLVGPAIACGRFSPPSARPRAGSSASARSRSRSSTVAAAGS